MCTFSLLKKYQKNKAFAALPKTGLHSAGLAKLARTVEGRLCIGFAQTVASLCQVRRSRNIEGGFIPAGFLTANRLRPDVNFTVEFGKVFSRQAVVLEAVLYPKSNSIASSAFRI
jgi:hypothetical protein